MKEMVAFVKADIGRLDAVVGATLVDAHGGTFVFKKGNDYVIVSMDTYDLYDPLDIKSFIGKRVTDAFVQRFVLRFYFDDGSRLKVKADPDGMFIPEVAVMVMGGDGDGVC
ncbi:hypothetical protein [Thermococcus nautili]|uniref:hypothetical protein n=1 Tax=Thermococcus nautili TaxID=195522 RepID=UPI0025551F2D|nr:hypothetical protein [Thermococcus nautili]